MRHAPAGLSHGWFISNLKFYDLQDSLSGGTLVAMALSVAVAFSVMLLTTCNIIISLYAILSIAGTIFVTVGSLVLLGWELNVLESVTISVAVGLSVDFAVHYGVAYRLAPEPDREGKVIFSLSRMGSAIAMAALTTFVAGAMMMPSTVLAYTQLGTFMMLIMCISWAFATFFFQCMCRCLGPQGSCGQIPLPKKLQRRVFSQVAAAGSSSQGKGSYGGDADAERYELEPLACVQKGGDKRKEEQEARPQLCNGTPPHLHVGRSQSEAGGNSANNGILAPPLRCQYPQTANCSCGDPPPPHLYPDWGLRPCAPTPQDPHGPWLLPRSPNTTNKPKAAALSANSDAAYTHGDGHVHCVRSPPAHFHHCAQGRTASSRQGPAHSCHLRNYCSHAARSAAQNPDRTPGSAPVGTADRQRPDTGRLSPDVSQNIDPPSLKQPQTPDPSDTPCTGDTPVPPTSTTETASIPLAGEDSVTPCRQSPKGRRAPSASPKKLNCFSRTVKTKSNSASESDGPKCETSTSPVAINAKASLESSC